MQTRRPPLAAGFLLALGGLFHGAAAQNPLVIKSRLGPVALDAGMKNNIAGLGMVTATLNGSKLAISGTFEGLKSNATMAHIHQGSAAGVRGPKILDLNVSKAISGSVSGSFDLSPEQLESFNKGKWYVQIHSEKAPDGNLWGWLVK